MRYLGIVFISLFCKALFSQTCSLTITITQIKDSEGQIVIGIYDNKESFPQVDKQYRVITTEIKKDSLQYIIKDLQKGEYAVAIFHDRNSDKICNTNFLGIPKEGYGFSNNYRPRISKPDFYDCKIDLINDVSITINLIYK